MLKRTVELLRSAPENTLSMRRDVPAATLTTFGLGADVPILLEPLSLQAAADLLGRLSENAIPFKILGAGSNLLLPDQSLAIPVIKLGQLWSRFEFVSSVNPARLTTRIDALLAASGAVSETPASGDRISLVALGNAPLMGLSRKLSAAGFSGLEFAAGIPGTAGGAIKMNAGAHGREISEIVSRCVVVSGRGEIREFSRADLGFSYRHSEIPEGSIVAAAELELVRRPIEECAEERSRCLEYRKRTQPLHLPSAGSVFRNPSPDQLSAAKLESDPGRHSAAALLESCGLKGVREGGVGYSEMHANWLVRTGDDAQSAQASLLIERGIDAVAQRYGISLRPEIQRW